MLYQVSIEVSNIPGTEGNLELFEYDKEVRGSIIEDIIIPYMKKKEMQFNGYFLKADDVVRIKVKTTGESVKVIADKENDANPVLNPKS